MQIQNNILLITTEECQSMFDSDDKEASLFETLARSDLKLMDKENKDILMSLKKIKLAQPKQRSLSLDMKLFVKKLNKELRTVQEFVRVIDNPSSWARQFIRNRFYFMSISTISVIACYYITHNSLLVWLGILNFLAVIATFVEYLKTEKTSK